MTPRIGAWRYGRRAESQKLSIGGEQMGRNQSSEEVMGF
jgi:hypothetical protein